MPKSVAKTFQSVLTQLEGGLGWVVAYVPFDVRQVWNAGGRPKVKGEINGFAFRTSLFPTRDGRHFLLINKQMQRGAKVVSGMKAKICLEPDTEKRSVTVPEQLRLIFGEERSLGKWFGNLSYSIQKWITDWVKAPKSADARTRRAEQVAEQMMAAMEAESETPPILQVAFARNPQAREGWEQMSPIQRRGQLLAIFYYRSPEARARRVEKVLREAAAAAERRRQKSED